VATLATVPSRQTSGSTATRYTDGAAYSQQGNYLTSFDKGTGLVDVIGAVDKIAA